VRAVELALAEIAAESGMIRDVHNVRVRETDRRRDRQLSMAAPIPSSRCRACTKRSTRSNAPCAAARRRSSG
jgi:hypothetical protein